MKYIVFLVLSTFLYVNVYANNFAIKLANSALDRTKSFVIYDGSYKKIKYPLGDVAKNRGVCTDVVIRSYRKLGVDLQELVHNDMKDNFAKYPSKRIWGLKKPDTNIDHRRVPNLREFFKRNGEELKISKDPKDYQVGDIVSWKLDNNLPHIGIVSSKKSKDGVPLIVHNIGWGPKLDDMLFDYTITGHYRYHPNE